MRYATIEMASARAGRPGLAMPVLFLSALVLVNGCDIFSLEQENPSELTADAVYTPANAPLLVNGAISDFECAFARYVLGSAIFGDELTNAFQNTELFNLDRRTINGSSSYSGACGGALTPGIYTSLSTARGTADVAYERLDGWTDQEVSGRMTMMGKVAAYGGLSLVVMGEAMCTSAINLGPEMTPAELFAEAIIRFDRAIEAAGAAGDETTLNLARLGKGRTLLNLGDAAAAANEVSAIPTDFEVTTSNDAVNVRRQNLIFVHTVTNSWSSVDPTFRDLTLGAQPDPRVLVRNSGREGTGTAIPIWTADKYPEMTSPIAIAKYAEAQLIIAEARAAAGDLVGAANAINNARNSGGREGLPLYDATGQTAEQVRAQIIEERRREFFLEGHRLGDVRRYNLALVPATGTTYTQGGGQYGDQRCFPLPNIERQNNPNIS